MGMNYIAATTPSSGLTTSLGCTGEGAIDMDTTVLDPSKISVPPIPRCWQATGVKVDIGDTFMSIQSGFEMVNFNFHTNGSSPAVPSLSALTAPASANG